MKNLAIFALVALLAVAVVPQASAGYLVTGDIVVWDFAPSYPGGPGGPFEVETTNRAVNISILTFCLEDKEGIEYNSHVMISDRAIAGGEDSGGDVISMATAMMYNDWLDGTLQLNGFVGTASQIDAAVQEAIWELEDEESGVANEIYEYYYATYGDGDNDISVTGINVATLWANADFTGVRQDVLNRVPEPASVAVWGFIVSVFGALYLRRRRVN